MKILKSWDRVFWEANMKSIKLFQSIIFRSIQNVKEKKSRDIYEKKAKFN